MASTLHQVSLGKDPAGGGKYRPDEAATGARLESQLGTTLTRDLSGNGDWVASSSGKVFDGASPPPTNYFNDKTFGQWQDSIQSHLNKQGVDVIVVDVAQRGLSQSQIDLVVGYIKSLPVEQQAKITVLK